VTGVPPGEHRQGLQGRCSAIERQASQLTKIPIILFWFPETTAQAVKETQENLRFLRFLRCGLEPPPTGGGTLRKELEK
jgi:hypothetical protein